jgi:hypothetical protein
MEIANVITKPISWLTADMDKKKVVTIGVGLAIAATATYYLCTKTEPPSPEEAKTIELPAAVQEQLDLKIRRSRSLARSQRSSLKSIQSGQKVIYFDKNDNIVDAAEITDSTQSDINLQKLVVRLPEHERALLLQRHARKPKIALKKFVDKIRETKTEFNYIQTAQQNCCAVSGRSSQ